MEKQQPNPSSYQENNAVDNVNGNWHRRLRLRKSSVSLIAKKRIRGQKNVDGEPSKYPSENEHTDNVVDTSSHTLTLTHVHSKDNANDLLEHLEHFHGGKRKPTSFPCDMCSFASSEFTVFREHQRTHRPDGLACESSNDILHTSSQITKHYNAQHCLESRHPCKKFKFNTKEPSDCQDYTMPAVENTEISSNMPVSGRHPGDTAESPKKEEILTHMASACNRKWGRKNWWKRKEVPQTEPDNGIPDIKFLIPKTEIPWPTSEFLPFSGPGLLNEKGELLNPVRILEETEHFLERSVNKGKKWPVILKGQPSPSCAETFPSEPNINQHFVQFPTHRYSEKDKLCGLMEKNNISIPPDCTAKIVGFKMVDGKKHVIVKVIPLIRTSNSQEAGKNYVPVPHEDLNDLQIHSYVDKLSNQICNGLGNTCTEGSSVNQESKSTSSSVQPDDQGLGEKQHKGLTEVVSQGKNRINDCNGDQHACCEILDAPDQLAISGRNLNVANHSDAKPTSPGLVLSFKNGNGLDERKDRKATTLSRYTENREATKKHQEKEIQDEGNRPELFSNVNITNCVGDLSSNISLNVCGLGEGMSSKHLAVASENNRSPHKNTNESEMGPTIPPASLAHQSRQTLERISNFPAFPERNIDPTPASLLKSTTDSVCNFVSEDPSLFHNDREQYKNSTDPWYHLPPGQDCSIGTVEEPHVALSSEESSFHNPDLNQTLQTLPVPTVNYLINNSENTFRSNAKKSDSCQFSTQQVGTCSLQAIPDSSQSNLQPSLLTTTESPVRRKTQQDMTTISSQGSVLKPTTQPASKPKEHELQASIPYWEPVLPATKRTLRLTPVHSSQPVKVPRLNQPVVVLNHPDTDIPEVTNIMRSVHRHKGAVQKVLLSQGTVNALSELNREPHLNSSTARSHHSSLVWRQGTVKERFILKLKLRRLRGRKFEVAPLYSKMPRSSFRCWFCGRVFTSQEVWIGHGQRHLMEATRDWSKLNYNIVL